MRVYYQTNGRVRKTGGATFFISCVLLWAYNVIEYAENGLLDNRSYEGVWFELVAHYVVHKIDFLDITDADDIANIGNFEKDTNAWFWELCMNLFGNIFFD